MINEISYGCGSTRHGKSYHNPTRDEEGERNEVTAMIQRKKKKKHTFSLMDAAGEDRTFMVWFGRNEIGKSGWCIMYNLQSCLMASVAPQILLVLVSVVCVRCFSFCSLRWAVVF